MFGLVTVFCFNFCQNKVLHVVFSSLNTYYIYVLKPQPVFLCCLIGIPGQLYLGLIGVSRQTQMQQNLQFNRVIKCNSAHCTELRFISFLSTGFTKGQKISKLVVFKIFLKTDEKSQHCKCLRGLQGICRFSLPYLWKRAVRITEKPYTPQRKRLCMLWGNPLIFAECGKTL